VFTPVIVVVLFVKVTEPVTEVLDEATMLAVNDVDTYPVSDTLGWKSCLTSRSNV
jgi:hypothetical protein